MLQLMYPMGLLAAAAVLVPLIIHLWNIRRGKTLLVGSVLLLTESALQTARSFKLSDWVLLLLRVLLILLIAFLLAGPFLRTKTAVSAGKGWILVQPDQLDAAYRQYKNQIDSLLKLGYSMRSFAVGFNELSLNDTAVAAPAAEHKIGRLALLNQLNSRIAPGLNAYVYTLPLQNEYADDVAHISYNLYLKPIHGFTQSRWIARAYTDADNELVVETANSDTAKTSYLTQKLSGPQNREGIQVSADSGKIRVKLAGAKSWTEADTSTLNIRIIDQTIAGDGLYLRSALSAIQQFTNRKIRVKRGVVLNATDNEQLIFWLSEKPITADQLRLVNKKAAVVCYASGRIVNTPSVINLNPGAANELNQTELYKHIEADDYTGVPVWEDGFGQPLLLKKTGDGAGRYVFYSRFNPQWTNLVWDENFAGALMPLLVGANRTTGFGFEPRPQDQRRVSDLRQVTKKASPAIGSNMYFEEKRLNGILWVGIIIVFMVERIVSLIRNKSEYAGTTG